MASPNVRTFTDQNFDSEVLGSPLPVLVHFSATWCGPCKMVQHTVDKIADDFAGKVKVGTLDIDDSPETAKKFAVRSAPTCIVFQDGRKTGGSQTGMADRTKLLQLLGLS